MNTALLIALPFVVAAGVACIAYVLMHARMEVAVAREREIRIIAESKLRMAEETLPARIEAAQETAHRQAFDQFMAGFRVEERRFLREGASRHMVLHERLYFRNIPLSNWVEHEFALTEGNLRQIDSASAFVSPARLADFSAAISTPKYLTH